MSKILIEDFDSDYYSVELIGNVVELNESFYSLFEDLFIYGVLNREDIFKLLDMFIDFIKNEKEEVEKDHDEKSFYN